MNQTDDESDGMGRQWMVAACWLGGLVAVAGSILPAAAEEPAPAPAAVVERTARGPAAKSFQVGVYLNVQPDCTSGTLPSIRLVAPPANGTVSIKRGKISATNYKQCLALEVPGFIAFYQSKPDFAGSDVVTLEIRYPQGRTEVQRITIDVGGPLTAPATRVAPAGQKI